MSLLYGPLDWTISAAGLALAYIAKQDTTLKSEAIASLNDVLGLPLSHGYVPYEEPLKACLKYLNGT